jgi:SAM-dependent methyltransferase
MTAQIETSPAMTLPTPTPGTPRWRAVRAALRFGAQFSAGLALGYRHGFDSGPMLDYVYHDQARGRLLIGRAIDRIYLNQIGWRAIRARRILLADTLRDLIATRRAAGLPTHIVDSAAGPGRYLLELIAAEDRGDLSALCRDLDPAGQRQGRALAATLGLTNVTFAPGDATDPADLARIAPQPQIVVASGIYEILTDDEAVRRSMRGVRALLAGGGTFVFTTQIAHPQLDLIANTLPHRDGQPWIMGVRSAATVAGWARQAGFSDIRTAVEPNGLFAVTVAVAPAK